MALTVKSDPSSYASGYSVSRRSFFRDLFLANACFARRLSPGFR